MDTSQEAIKSSEISRKRKAHRKSRSGCANCKLRRCDEGLPECHECLSYGVCCNYDIRVPNLQPRYASSLELNGNMQTYNKAFVMKLPSLDESKLNLTTGNLSRLQRFKIRTAMSLAPPELRHLYENEIYHLTFRYPFLMHFVQTITSIHDRYLSSKPGQRTIEEIHHWNKGISLFNNKLSAPLHPPDRDAIWAGASMLGVITFASIEFQSLEETWPLSPSDKSEPEWLKMGQGKSRIMSFAQPERADSIFHGLISSFPTIEFSLENVPSIFIKLYELHLRSAESSPYTIPIISVFAPLRRECPSSLMALFYSFNNCIQNQFGHLVFLKDPRALLIMAYWYSKLCTGQWWLKRRAVMEGRATCIYLERYCTEDPIVRDLLKEPQSFLFSIAL